MEYPDLDKAREDVKNWQGVNRYITHDAKEAIKEAKETTKKDDTPTVGDVKHSRTQLVDMVRAKQVEILNQLGVEEIPRLEGDRVDLIIKLQK